jgi:hypothetical protein
MTLALTILFFVNFYQRLERFESEGRLIMRGPLRNRA